MSVTTVGIRELKTHLSKYMQQVKAGSTIIITERGKPVGQILPLAGKTVEEKMLALREAGLVYWEGEGLPPQLEPVEPVELLSGGKTASEIVLEDRE